LLEEWRLYSKNLCHLRSSSPQTCGYTPNIGDYFGIARHTTEIDLTIQ
jgi:hypothetical protein